MAAPGPVFRPGPPQQQYIPAQQFYQTGMPPQQQFQMQYSQPMQPGVGMHPASPYPPQFHPVTFAAPQQQWQQQTMPQMAVPQMAPFAQPTSSAAPQPVQFAQPTSSAAPARMPAQPIQHFPAPPMSGSAQPMQAPRGPTPSQPAAPFPPALSVQYSQPGVQAPPPAQFQRPPQQPSRPAPQPQGIPASSQPFLYKSKSKKQQQPTEADLFSAQPVELPAEESFKVCGVDSREIFNRFVVFKFLTWRFLEAALAINNYNTYLNRNRNQSQTEPPATGITLWLQRLYPLSLLDYFVVFLTHVYIIWLLYKARRLPKAGFQRCVAVGSSTRNVTALLCVLKRGTWAAILVLLDCCEVTYSIFFFIKQPHHDVLLWAKLVMSCVNGLLLLPELARLCEFRKWFKGVPGITPSVFTPVVDSFVWTRSRSYVFDLLEIKLRSPRKPLTQPVADSVKAASAKRATASDTKPGIEPKPSAALNSAAPQPAGYGAVSDSEREGTSEEPGQQPEASTTSREKEKQPLLAEHV